MAETDQLARAIAAIVGTAPRLHGRRWVHAGLTFETASNVWADTQRDGAGTPTLLNEDFARCDITLTAVAPGAAIHALLTDRFAIPVEVVPRLLARLPVVVARDVRLAQRDCGISAIAAAGGTASSELLALQRFAVQAMSVIDPVVVGQALQFIGGLDRAACQVVLDGAVPIGKMTATRVRWLQYAIRQARGGSLKVTRVDA